METMNVRDFTIEGKKNQSGGCAWSDWEEWERWGCGFKGPFLSLELFAGEPYWRLLLFKMHQKLQLDQVRLSWVSPMHFFFLIIEVWTCINQAELELSDLFFFFQSRLISWSTCDRQPIIATYTTEENMGISFPVCEYSSCPCLGDGYGLSRIIVLFVRWTWLKFWFKGQVEGCLEGDKSL